MQMDSVNDHNQENFLRLANQVFQPGPGARRNRRRDRDKMPTELFVVGQCQDMCPRPEFEMRKKEKLLHRLERAYNLHPVKEFTRSAAGSAIETPELIRTPEVLQQTVNYLLNDVVTSERTVESYEFITNRLKSVQQDLFKQQCSASVSLPILEPIVRYLAWATYWFCEDRAFQHHLHNLMLLDSLKSCLRLAEDNDQLASTDIEALYLLFSLEDHEPLLRAVNVNRKKKIPLLYQCQRLGFNRAVSNFVAICRTFKELPILLAAFAAARHLEDVRREGLKILSVSHSCQTNVTPVAALVTSGLFSSVPDAIEACKYYGITIDKGQIIFKKNTFNFNNQQQMRPYRKENWIQEKLSTIYLPDLLFNNLEHNG